MTDLDLYKFVHKNNIEYHWHNGEVFMLVNIFQLSQFHAILPKSLLDEEGIECRLKDGYIGFEMSEICESCDIDINEVFDSDEVTKEDLKTAMKA